MFMALFWCGTSVFRVNNDNDYALKKISEKEKEKKREKERKREKREKEREREKVSDGLCLSWLSHTLASY